MFSYENTKSKSYRYNKPVYAAIIVVKIGPYQNREKTRSHGLQYCFLSCIHTLYP